MHQGRVGDDVMVLVLVLVLVLMKARLKLKSLAITSTTLGAEERLLAARDRSHQLLAAPPAQPLSEKAARLFHVLTYCIQVGRSFGLRIVIF